MGPGDLSKALAPLARATDPRLLVGHETFDDAGIFVLSDDLALVQTVDFFAPIVDDPFQFGQIAAANALSDIYAMGGEPLTALCIVGFPVGKLPIEVLSDILRGGQDKVHEAGASIAGGHSILDDEVKFGLAVTGRVHPRAIFSNASARPGFRLVLTKRIGTGILTTAAKRGALSAQQLQPVIDSMRSLNAAAARAATAVGVTCATDVTGFGLLGHASHIARASNVTIRLDLASVPLFDGTRQALEAGMRPAGAERNAEYLEPLVNWGGTAQLDRSLLVDPQTSGGLLVAVPPDRLDDYLALVPGAVSVGEVLPRGAWAIQVAE